MKNNIMVTFKLLIKKNLSSYGHNINKNYNQDFKSTATKKKLILFSMPIPENY